MRNAIFLFILFIGCLSNNIAAQNCVSKSIFFKKGSSKIKSELAADLEGFVKSNIQPDSSYLLEVYGYTDSSNSHKYNLQLADKRIKATEKLIAGLKYSNIIVRTYNYGESHSDSTLSENKQRKTVLAIVPLVNDSNVVLYDRGAKVYIPYYYFDYGICESGVRLVSKTKDDNVSFNVHSQHQSFKCLKMDFVFPFSAFFDSSITDYLNYHPYLFGCKKFHSNKSLLERINEIEITIDTIAKTFTFSSNCWGFNYITPCCATKPVKPYYKFIFPPESNAQHQSRIEYRNKKGYTPILPDSNNTIVSFDSRGKFYSSITLKGQVLYYQAKAYEVLKSKKFMKPPSDSHLYVIKIPIEKYAALKSKNVPLQICIPKNTSVDSMGLLLRGYEKLIICKPGKSKRAFTSANPRTPFDIVFFRNGKMYVVGKKDIRRKTKKKVENYKVKKRTFSAPA